MNTSGYIYEAVSAYTCKRGISRYMLYRVSNRLPNPDEVCAVWSAAQPDRIFMVRGEGADRYYVADGNVFETLQEMTRAGY